MFKIVYNADMTIGSDLLGSPVFGLVWPSFWRVSVERRGSSEVLVWREAESAASPVPIAKEFVSLPRTVPSATIKRGEEQRRQRLKGRNPGERAGAEELLAAFSAIGGQIVQFRQGVVPFFEAAGALDDFIQVSGPNARRDPGLRLPLGPTWYLQAWRPG